MNALRPNRIAAVALVIAAAILVFTAVQTWRYSHVSNADGVNVGEVNEETIAPIAQSMPLEMVIPAINLRAAFEPGNCRFKNGAIDPASMDKACVFTAENRPYQLPGTATPDITVIAGHTGAGVPGVFNGLYDGAGDRHTVNVGDQLFLKTVESGERWLVYRATDLHSPDKQSLGEDESVWGAGPMPGRLLTISCIQPVNPLASSVKNAVVGWQFVGVSESKSGEQGMTLDRPVSEIPELPAHVRQVTAVPAAVPREMYNPTKAPVPMR